KPLTCIVREATEDLLDLVDAEPGGNVEHDLLAHRFRARLVAGLGNATGPHLPKRQPERIEVVLDGGAARANAFGRHVVRRSAVRWSTRPTSREARALLCKAEVQDNRLADRPVGIRRDHDVARLEIAVDQPSRVDGCDTLANIACDPPELVGR